MSHKEKDANRERKDPGSGKKGRRGREVLKRKEKKLAMKETEELFKAPRTQKREKRRMFIQINREKNRR